MRINEDRKTCERVVDQLNKKVDVLNSTIDIQSQKISNLMAIESKHKDQHKINTEQLKLSTEQIETLQHDVNKYRLRARLASVGLIILPLLFIWQ